MAEMVLRLRQDWTTSFFSCKGAFLKSFVIIIISIFNYKLLTINYKLSPISLTLLSQFTFIYTLYELDCEFLLANDSASQALENRLCLQNDSKTRFVFALLSSYYTSCYKAKHIGFILMSLNFALRYLKDNFVLYNNNIRKGYYTTNFCKYRLSMYNKQKDVECTCYINKE